MYGLCTCCVAVTAACDAGSGSWSITTSAGDTVTARVLVLAQGEQVCRVRCCGCFNHLGCTACCVQSQESFRMYCMLCAVSRIIYDVLHVVCSLKNHLGRTHVVCSLNVVVETAGIALWPLHMLCRFGSSVDAGSGSWSITTSAGDTVTARVLVLAQSTWCFGSGVFALWHRGLCM
jgi:hypothetical protein